MKLRLPRARASLTGRSRRARRGVLHAGPRQVEKLEERALLSTVTIDLAPSQDGTLYEDPNGSIANGAGSYFFVGPNATSLRRGLIAFDIAGVVPEGAIITDVVLTLHNSGGVSLNRNVFLHEMHSDWGTGTSNAPGNEFRGTNASTGDATWLNTFFTDSFWGTPGGDFDTSISAVSKVRDKGYYEWSDPGMIDDVQGWLDDPTTNFGWLLRSNEGARSVKRFDSGDHKSAARRPVLSITYEEPVTPGGIEGRKWHDLNVNGRRDRGEPWLNGWTIELLDYNTGEFLESYVTEDIDFNEDGQIDENTERGWYRFTVTPGRYLVREVMQPGWIQSYPSFSVDFGDGDNFAGSNNRQGAPSGGFSFSDGQLHFDIAVDATEPRDVSFYVQLPFDQTLPVQGEVVVTQVPTTEGADANRLIGHVTLTQKELLYLLDGDLYVSLDPAGSDSGEGNDTGAPVGGSGLLDPGTGGSGSESGGESMNGALFGSGVHIVRVRSGKVVPGRNFGNYQPGDDDEDDGPVVEPPPMPGMGFLFGGDEGSTTIVVTAPDVATPPPGGTTDTPDDPFATSTSRQILAWLNDYAIQNPEVASDIDELFGTPLALPVDDFDDPADFG